MRQQAKPSLQVTTQAPCSNAPALKQDLKRSAFFRVVGRRASGQRYHAERSNEVAE
jgi:hypothetical protein